jgi:2-C-methyl-D-erythritol 4-phosphate cytidylyltransferase
MPDSPPPAHCSAIIVAAGSSRRMGFDKLAAQLGNTSVLQRTLDAFLDANCIETIVVVCPEDRWEMIASPDFKKPVTRVDGGKDRQDSVANGLDALPPETKFVAVHDGARPLIDPKDIAHCIAEAGLHRAAALARRVTETVKRSDADDFNVAAVSRENLWFMETPQVFEIELLREGYAKVLADGLSITDEVSAVEAVGVAVKFVESAHPNLKITTPADLALAEALLR